MYPSSVYQIIIKKYRKSKKFFITITILIQLIISIPSSFTQIENNAISYSLKNPVTLDGKWTTSDEWNDATELSLKPSPWNIFPGTNGIAYSRIKHDDSYLYVLIDFITDSTPGSKLIDNYYSDFAGVYLDLRPRGEEFRSDVYCFFISKYSWEYHGLVRARAEQFDFDNSQQTFDKSKRSMSKLNNPYSKDKHTIYEFKIPLVSGTEIRFYLACDDTSTGNHMMWPLTYASSSNWGTLYFSDNTLEERLEMIMPLISDAEARINSLNYSEFNSLEAKSKLDEAINRYNNSLELINSTKIDKAEKEVQNVPKLIDESTLIESLFNNASRALNDASISIDKAIKEDRLKGLSDAQKLFEEAKTALVIRDYSKATSLAQQTKSIADNAEIEPLLYLPISMNNVYIITAIVASISSTYFTRRYLLKRKELTGKKYEKYLAKLEDLRSKGRISERAYFKLKYEYEDRISSFE